MKQILLSSAIAIAGATLFASAQSRQSKATQPFNIVEATIPQMQAAMKSGPRHLARDRAPVPRAHRHLRGQAARGDLR